MTPPLRHALVSADLPTVRTSVLLRVENIRLPVVDLRQTQDADGSDGAGSLDPADFILALHRTSRPARPGGPPPPSPCGRPPGGAGFSPGSRPR